MPGQLDEVIAKLNSTIPKERSKAIKNAKTATARYVWMPNPGPQSDAYLSKADIVLFGGRAGCGKSQVAIGWAVNEAQTGIIFRRELSQTDGLERDGKIIIKDAAGFNGSDIEWTWPTGKTLKLGGMKTADSWMAHAGRERDFIAFDEAGEFLEVQVASIRTWLRAPPGRRTRMILASNPPRSSEGLWIIEWFAPWLDEHHVLYPTPAGQLLWAVFVSRTDGNYKTIWVDGPGEYDIDGETYTAESRTFIPATLEDNPYRNNPEYIAKLRSLPEPLRSQVLYGDFSKGLKDNANQIIPTDWVRLAFKRHTPVAPPGVPMCAIGVDCTGGGDDPMVQAIRYDGWYAPLVKTPGSEIPAAKAGSVAAGLVLANRRDQAMVVVDMGGGYGGPLYEHLKENEIECIAYKGAEGTTRRSREGKLRFTNKRSAAYWAFREALDPDQPGGSPIALDEDSRLLAGLTAVTFEVTAQGIKALPKVMRNNTGKVIGGVMAILGFSPDEADAVVMAWFEGPRELTNALDWLERQDRKGVRGRLPKVIMGRSNRR